MIDSTAIIEIYLAEYQSMQEELRYFYKILSIYCRLFPREGFLICDQKFDDKILNVS